MGIQYEQDNKQKNYDSHNEKKIAANIKPSEATRATCKEGNVEVEIWKWKGVSHCEYGVMRSQWAASIAMGPHALNLEGQVCWWLQLVCRMEDDQAKS